MTLPTALLAFKPLCDDDTCHRSEMVGSDYCAVHSGCGHVIGFHPFAYECGNESVEIGLDADGNEIGLCLGHGRAACAVPSCTEDAIDPDASDRNYDLCPRCKDEADYEFAVDHYGYTGPGPGRF